MLFKLAVRNVKKQVSNYLIYFITVTLTVALIFAIDNFIYSDIITKLEEGNFNLLKPIFTVAVVALCLIISCALGYVTAFLIRRRKKEFGLYLTLGMTRGNILALFMGETLLSFILSLGFGILLGMGLYCALTQIFINFIGVAYNAGGFNAYGILLTSAMVAGVFLVASAASLLYLRFAKISALLYGEKKVEKAVGKPVLWLCLAGAGVVLLICAFALASRWLSAEDINELLQFKKLKHLLYIIPMFIVALTIIPAGTAKGVLPLIIKRNEKTQSASAVGLFTARQLSGRLNANSAMAGALSVLIAVAIAVPNIFLVQNGIISALVKQEYPFDVNMYCECPSYGDYDYDGEAEPIDFKDGLAVIEKYSQISNSYEYAVYHSFEMTGNAVGADFWKGDVFVKESDFNRLRELLGKPPVRLDGGYFLQYTYGSPRSIPDFKDVPLVLGGVAYFNAGYEKLADGVVFTNKAVNDYIIVVPDSAMENAPPEALSVYAFGMAVTLKNARYDAFAMQEELTKLRTDSDFNFLGLSQEQARLEEVQKIALWLLGCLFASAVFILLSMSMLALKMLTMLEEDKPRYKTLWRIGADEGTAVKSLLLQMGVFYFLPFVLPFFLSAPFAVILSQILALQGVEFSSASVFGQVFGFTGIMFVLYALYFTVTCLIACREVKKYLRNNR